MESALASITGAAFPHAEALVEAVAERYAERGYEGLWTTERRATKALGDLLRTLEGNEFSPYRLRYGTADLRRLVDEEFDGAARRARAEVLASLAFITLARDIHEGVLHPGVFDQGWHRTPPNTNYGELLDQLGDGRTVAALLNGLQPPHEGFQRLRRAARHYADHAREEGWRRIDAGDLLREGSVGERVRQVRSRLHFDDDLHDEAPQESAFTASDAGRDRYDPRLTEAVKRFQRRHGLAVDGIVGPATLAAMNVSPEERLRTIALNLMRWRWLPDDLGKRHVRVNLPAYRLEAFADGQKTLSSKVVIGSEFDPHHTPVFSDVVEYLVIHPYWNIPHSIVVDEIVPKLRSNPRYLVENHYEVTRGYGHDAEAVDGSSVALQRLRSGDLRLRQKFGPWNALGRIKFMLPNEYAIYLHDTPAEELFGRDRRAFSHGCIRVEQAFDLATFALERSAWDPIRLSLALVTEERRRVDLDDPLPVHLLYWTAFVDDAGALQFRPDLYGHDERMVAALRQEVTQEAWLMPLPTLQDEDR